MQRTQFGQQRAAFKNAQISETTTPVGVYYYVGISIALLVAVFLLLPKTII